MDTGERVKQAVSGTVSAIQKEATGQGGEGGTQATLSREIVESIIADWGQIPQKAARKMIERNGLPNEGTRSRLIWFGNGPWKRTIVYRDEVPHNFPKPHTDVLEQFIDDRVPPEKTSDIAAFDGSVIPERTKGKVSARCDMEEMNFLALKRLLTMSRNAWLNIALIGGAFGALLWLERRRPLRRAVEPKLRREVRNIDKDSRQHAISGLPLQSGLSACCLLLF